MDSTNPQFRENAAVRDRLDITKPSGTSVARSQKTETRDYQNTEKLASTDTRSEDTRSTNGSNRRGGVLDISV